MLACLLYFAAAPTVLRAQAPTPVAPGGAAEPSSAELLRQAGQAIDANQFPVAKALLDKLRARDASQLNLWAAFAILSLRQNDAATAVVDFRKELALHPEAIQLYDPLVGTLLQLKRGPEAMDTLKTWSAAAPADPRPVRIEVGLLLDEANPQAALKAGKAGLARLPEGAASDPELQYTVGSAELQAGEKAAGAKRLSTLLSAVDDLSLRNSIAYGLGDAGVELPAAERAERQVLEQLGLQSEGWSLEGGPQPLRVGTPLLVAAWDTLGWILFREGKAAEAEPLVRAAWRNKLQGTIGEHLSEIEAARGQQAAARADLRLAIAAAKAAGEQSGAAQAALAGMENRLQATEPGPAGKDVTAVETAAALQRLRTFPLGAAAGRSGSTLFVLLISRGKVVGQAAAPGQPASPGQAAAPGQGLSLAHADFSALFPAPGTFVQLVHLGTVNCAPRGCEVVLQP